MRSTVVPIRLSPEEVALRAATCDEYGECQRLLALNEPNEQLAKALKAKIEGWHKDDAGDVPVTVRGALYELQLSPRRKERTITEKRKAFNALKKILGLDGLIAVIEISMGVLDKNVPKSLQAAFVTEEQSGYRTFTTVPLFAPVNFRLVEPIEKAA